MPPPLVFEYDKGVSNQDEVRLPQGFVTLMQNWIYDPDDRDRIFKIFGRTANGGLPAAATAANTAGFDYFKFSNVSNVFVLGANTQLYETPAGLAIGSWSSVVDKAAVPAAFIRGGTFLKSIPSGDNRYITFSGAIGERPLIRDEDGDWHFLGLNKPPTLDLAGVTTLGLFTRPTTSSSPGSTDFGTNDGGSFTNAGRAFDNDMTTFASARILPHGDSYLGVRHYKATDWAFTAVGTTPSQQKLTVVIARSAAPPDSTFGSDSGGSEPAITNMYVQLSTNAGSTYTTIYLGTSLSGVKAVETTIAAGVTWANIRVRVVMEFVSGEIGATCNVYEIYAKAQDSGRATLITAGTYYYAQTEVYQVTLASGKTILVESPPSDPIKIVADGTTMYGFQLTLPGSQTTNLLTDGYKHDPVNKRTLFRNLYRTTSTGVWPDLGYIGTAAIDATVFVDNFITTTETTLGIPTINVVFAGIAALNAASPAPAFLDAVRYRAAIVCIPASDPYRIQWSLPGFPDYWPLPAQDLATLPTARNDQLVGISSVGEYLILFTRTRLLRLRNLPFVDRPNFDPSLIQVDILSPNEGLAGSVFSYCTFQSQKGFSVLCWASDNGIWMTDGTLPSEGGLGIVKLTANLNWRKLVDPTRLRSSRMTYDSVLQMIFFDYYAAVPEGQTVGPFRTLGLHTAPDHWVQSGQDHTVPKITGPHTSPVLARVIGDFQNALRHWSLDTTRLKLYNERTGPADDGQPILSVLETGWQQPGGPQEEYLCNLGSLYHSDWGPSETCDLDLLARRDDTGVIQEVRKGGLSLAGAAVTNFYLNRASKSLRLRITHNGLTTSDGRTPIKALGPCGIEGEVVDALFGV